MKVDFHHVIVSDALTGVLHRGQDDWLQLVEIEDEIIQAARKHGRNWWSAPRQSDILKGTRPRKHDKWFELRLSRSLSLLERAFTEGLLQAGSISNRFDAWQGSPSEWLERIESGWRELGSSLSMWDVAWFNLTEKGNELANDLYPQYPQGRGN